MERNISLEAQHLPGVMNSIADRESRAWLNRSEWKLSPKILPMINGPLLTVLFASQLSNQVPTFVSWKPDLPIMFQGGNLLRKMWPGHSECICCHGQRVWVQSQACSQSIRVHSDSPSASAGVIELSILCSCRDWSEHQSSYLVVRNDSTSMPESPSKHHAPTSRVGCIRER